MRDVMLFAIRIFSCGAILGVFGGFTIAEGRILFIRGSVFTLRQQIRYNPF